MVDLFVIGILVLILTLTWIFASRKWFAFPVALFLVFSGVQYLPDALGYPIHERYVQGREGLVLGGYQSVLMVLFKGETTPRLVMILDPKKAREAMEKADKKPTVIVFSKMAGGGSDGDGAGTGIGSGSRVQLRDAELPTKD